MRTLPASIVNELRIRHAVEVSSAEELQGGYDTRAKSWRLDTNRSSLVLRLDHGVSLQTATWLASAQEHAASRGVPCCPPLRAEDGSAGFHVGEATATVRAFTAGTLLDRDNPTAVQDAGATLGLLHTAGRGNLAERPATSPWDSTLWGPGQDPPALRDPELDAWHQAFVQADRRPGACGLVHGDFWAGNIVVAAGRIAAVIDWSEARLDLCARELAWATWEFGHDDNYQLDADRARTFLAGYRDVRGPWEQNLAANLIRLMRVEIRRNARYSLGDPGDEEYTGALVRSFAHVRQVDAAALLNP